MSTNERGGEAMKCAHCKHWDSTQKAAHFAHAPTDGARRLCLRILHAEQYAPTGTAPAVLTDGDDYAAALWTDPAFGCVLFEPQAS